MFQFELRIGSVVPLSSLLELYAAVGWVAYTREESRADLENAIANSSFVVSAWQDERLVGLARVMSDDVSICYVQDILVHPDHQRRGIGEQLICLCITRYAHVRSKVLLTDDEERQRLFYEKAGFRNIKDIDSVNLNIYVQMQGVT